MLNDFLRLDMLPLVVVILPPGLAVHIRRSVRHLPGLVRTDTVHHLHPFILLMLMRLVPVRLRLLHDVREVA